MAWITMVDKVPSQLCRCGRPVAARAQEGNPW
jgi:hypothetical protein